MLNFQNPLAFILVLLLPLYLLLRKFGILQSPSTPAVLGDWNGKIFEWKDISHKFLSVLTKICFYGGFIFGILALADPVIRHQEKIYTSRGTDILFVLDTSPSMVAKDVNGKTRLQASKDAVEILVSENTGARMGIVAMGTKAAVVVPPTQDDAVFKSRLSSITEGTMGDGSAIGDGISTAVYHLVSSNAPKKCIVLFTDGENNAGAIHPETAAELARNNDITLYVFGVGSKGTVAIEYTDPSTGQKYSGYLNSDFDSSSLRKIASIANGRYYETATISDLATALDTISRTEITTQGFTYKTVNDSYYKKIILVTLILFAFGFFTKRFLLKYKKIIFVRSLFFALAFIFGLLSYFDISFGTYLVPVQKSSNAVSLVFDVSNSMLSDDEDSGMTRLKAASVYAKKLLSKMDNTSVSVVIAKGDGILAVPLTEDFASIESLLEVLSPSLMSAPGTSLGKGILAAKSSFPENISAVEYIWLFTDGGETDGHLKDALSECIKKGIQVSVIGFGTKEGKDILAGDGKTLIHSSLTDEELISTIEHASKKIPKNNVYPVPQFVRAGDKGSGRILLSPLERNQLTGEYTSYETKNINQYKLFLTMSIICIALAILLSEFNSHHKKTNLKNISALTIIAFLFSGCSNIKSKASDSTLKGVNFYKQAAYEKSIGEFLSSYEMARDTDNEEIMDYSLYNLAASYSALNEDSAALEKLNRISNNASSQIKYNAYFNSGVIEFQKGNKDKAAEFFRKALEIDGTKIEAKINLELSQTTTTALSNQNEATVKPAAENNAKEIDMENTIFERIKENDKGQWKNSETAENTDLSEDY